MEISNPPYDARAVANYFLDLSNEKEIQITNLKLQKLIFFVHGHFLADYKKPLVKNDFEAWDFGPVVKILYKNFKKFGPNPIKDKAQKFNPIFRKKEVVRYNFPKEIEEFLEEIFSFYSRISSGQLVKMTHIEGGPWDVTKNHSQEKLNINLVIDDKLIQEHFLKPGDATIFN